MNVLLKTGTGLEETARDEVLAKAPGAAVTTCPRGMKGHVEIRMPLDLAGEPPAFLHRLRCFETMHVVVHEERPGRGWLDTKRHAEARMRELFASTFTALRNPATTVAAGTSWRGPFELAIPVPGFLRRLGFTQAQLEAIAGREAHAAGTSIVMKRKGTPRLYFKCFPGTLLGLLRLPAKPGNLSLARVHPTGLFPNHAFGLIHHALATHSTGNAVSSDRGDHLVVVDPMVGAGTIPAMLVVDAAHFTSLLPFKSKLAITGIEKDAGFHDMASTNFHELTPDPDHVSTVVLLHDDFSTVDLQDVDVIITQPPYGHAIAWSNEALAALHRSLFVAASRWLRPDGVLAMITPRDDIVMPVARETGWIDVASRRVREHDITCKLHAFRMHEA